MNALNTFQVASRHCPTRKESMELTFDFMTEYNLSYNTACSESCRVGSSYLFFFSIQIQRSNYQISLSRYKKSYKIGTCFSYVHCSVSVK